MCPIWLVELVSNDDMLIKGIISFRFTSSREYDLESATQAIDSRRAETLLPGNEISCTC